LVWTDRKVQELSALVIPTADAIERPGKSLEDGTNFESRFVQKVKKQANDLATYQGVFVATPSGMLLAGSHEAIHDPRKVEQLLRQGVEKWGKLSPAERLMNRDTLSKAVAELGEVDGRKRFPQDGLVLSVICRDLPRSPKPSTSPSRNAYNQDFAWFHKDEARAFLPDKPIKGARVEVRRDLLERLARFHLVDLVRGHTASFPQKAVERTELTAEVIDVKGNLVSLSCKGRMRTSEVHDGVHIEGKWNAKGPGIPEPQTRGVDAKLEGQAVYDLKAEKFVSFELVAVSERWGGNAYNGRLDERDFGPAPLGFVLKLAGDSPAERVPPMYFRSYGWK
jgi:hypothetical protein